MQLTESLYLKGLQCHKYLWFQLNRPEVLTAVDQNTEFGRGSGEEACRLGRSLFPDGRNISAQGMDEKIAQTKEYLDTGPVTLFDAVFEYQGNHVVIDVLEKDVSGALALHRLRGITRIRKPHIQELSFQYYVLSGLGHRIETIEIIYLNKNYVREEELDLSQLYLRTDLKTVVEEMQKTLPGELEEMHSVIKGPLPDRPIGTHCSSPRLCEAREHCWRSIPSPSVFDISTLSPELKMKFYNRGIVEFHQIDDFTDLSAHQKLQVQSHLSAEDSMDKEKLSRFLSTLSYPISHLDFEAFQQAVPLWKGVRPYAHIPFQYSLHIEEKDGTLEHKEFLGTPGTDPRRQLAQKLVEDSPEEGSVLVYNQAFEKRILTTLSALYPEFSDSLDSISNRIVDLMIPFRNKHFYSPDMEGRYSIKNVLPALVPEMADAYEELDMVHNGLEAMKTFSQMKESDGEKRQALLKYCELDTLAMVRILKALKKIIR